MNRYIDVTDLSKQISDFKRAVNSPNSDYMTGYICALSVTEGIIAETPTADVVEVRHGEWVSNDLGGYKYAFYCSECGWVDGYPFNDRHKYCPNCGAKMNGEGRTNND